MGQGPVALCRARNKCSRPPGGLSHNGKSDSNTSRTTARSGFLLGCHLSLASRQFRSPRKDTVEDAERQVHGLERIILSEW